MGAVYARMLYELQIKKVATDTSYTYLTKLGHVINTHTNPPSLVDMSTTAI